MSLETLHVALKASVQPFATYALSLGKCTVLYFFPFAVTYIAALPYMIDALETRNHVREACLAVLMLAGGLHLRSNVLLWYEDSYVTTALGMFLSMVLCGVQWIVLDSVLGLKQREASGTRLAVDIKQAKQQEAQWRQEGKQQTVGEAPSTVIDLR